MWQVLQLTAQKDAKVNIALAESSATRSRKPAKKTDSEVMKIIARASKADSAAMKKIAHESRRDSSTIKTISVSRHHILA